MSILRLNVWSGQVTLLYLCSLDDCPLIPKIMDEFLECRYQVLKRPSNDPETFKQQKRKADQTKKRAKVLISWLRAKEESTPIKQIKEKLAEGYEVLMLSMWKLLDEQGDVKKISMKSQKGSGRRPWQHGLMEGMVDKNGKKWLMYL